MTGNSETKVPYKGGFFTQSHSHSLKNCMQGNGQNDEKSTKRNLPKETIVRTGIGKKHRVECLPEMFLCLDWQKDQWGFLRGHDHHVDVHSICLHFWGKPTRFSDCEAYPEQNVLALPRRKSSKIPLKARLQPRLRCNKNSAIEVMKILTIDENV